MEGITYIGPAEPIKMNNVSRAELNIVGHDKRALEIYLP